MALYSSNRRQGLQPLTGFTPQQDGRIFTIVHSIAWRCIHPTAVRVYNRWRGSLRSKMAELSPLTIQSHSALFIQPPSGFTTADGVQSAARWPNFHHCPFNRMALYSSNRRQGFQPLTGFSPQQAGRTFTIHHWPFTKSDHLGPHSVVGQSDCPTC